MLTIIGLLVTISADPCSAEVVPYRQMLSTNAGNVNNVTVGMTVPEVKKLMGNFQSEVRDGPLDNPWKIEVLGNTSVYHYLTRRHPPFTPILEQQATPVIFVNGKVTAIGRGFLRQARTGATSSNSPSSKATGESIESRLKTLKGLYDSGTIDQKTYDAQRQRILDSI